MRITNEKNMNKTKASINLILVSILLVFYYFVVMVLGRGFVDYLILLFCFSIPMLIFLVSISEKPKTRITQFMGWLKSNKFPILYLSIWVLLYHLAFQVQFRYSSVALVIFKYYTSLMVMCLLFVLGLLEFVSEVVITFFGRIFVVLLIVSPIIYFFEYTLGREAVLDIYHLDYDDWLSFRQK